MQSPEIKDLAIKLSFIIPLVRFKCHLEDTIKAISHLKGLEDRPYEILLIQNGPPRPVPSWLANFPQITVIHHPQKSIPQARNRGIKAAQAPLVIFLDEDSVCPPQWLEQGLRFLASPHMAAYQSPSRRGKEIIRHEDFYTKLKQYQGLLLFDTGASIFKKEALLEVGGFDESFKRVEDNDLATRLSRRGWMLAYGSLVVGGEETPPFLQQWQARLESIKQVKRLYQKFEIPLQTKIFSSNFQWGGKFSRSESLLNRLLLWLMPASAVTPIEQKPSLRFMSVFIDSSGKSRMLKARLGVLFTRQEIIFLIGQTAALSTQDQYLYQLFFEAQKLVNVELDQIQDENFVRTLSIYLR